MSGKGDQVPLKPAGFSARSNEGKLNDNIPHGGGGKENISENGNSSSVSSSCFSEDTFHMTLACKSNREGEVGAE